MNEFWNQKIPRKSDTSEKCRIFRNFVSPEMRHFFGQTVCYKIKKKPEFDLKALRKDMMTKLPTKLTKLPRILAKKTGV